MLENKNKKTINFKSLKPKGYINLSFKLNLLKQVIFHFGEPNFY